MDREDRPPVLVESDESEEEEVLGDLRQHLRQKVPSEAWFKGNQGRRRRSDLDRKEGETRSVFSRLGSVEQNLHRKTRKGAAKRGYKDP